MRDKKKREEKKVQKLGVFVKEGLSDVELCVARLDGFFLSGHSTQIKRAAG